MNCNDCVWKFPDTCKACKHEEEEKARTPNQQRFDENALKIGLHNATVLLAQWHEEDRN